MGFIGFLVDFQSYMIVFWVGRGHIGLVAVLRFKRHDSQPDSSNLGPVPSVFHDFEHVRKHRRGFLAWYLSCFRPGCFQIRISDVLGQNQKEPRQKVMQIRSGITSGSALFDLFMLN